LSARLSVVEGSPDFGLSGMALRDLKPAVSHDVHNDSKSLLKDEYAKRGINSLCVLPLIVGGKGVGALALYAADIGVFGDDELRVSARLGIALFPNDAADSDGLLRNAEAALKKAKKAGERYLFYEQKMTERVAEKLALENKLRRALENGEFVLHYQPKVE